MQARKVLLWTVVPVLVLAVTNIALAFTLGGVDGVWGVVDTNGATCDRWATGPGDAPTTVQGFWWNQTPPNTDENQVRYGEMNDNCLAFASQSGFGFDGNDDVGSPADATPFYLGKFTHYNRPIQSDNSFLWADLTITTAGLQCNDASTPTEGSSLQLVYRFSLEETPNESPCAYSPVDPSDNYCPDRVTVDQVPAQVFTCPDGIYTIYILGFTTQGLGGGACEESYDPGAVSANYITQEGQANVACLWAQIGVEPTAADLISFTATPVAPGILVEWETATEIGIVGYSLYRAEAPVGTQVPLTGDLIPAKQSAVPLRASYEFLDEATEPGVTYYYWLEDLDTDGNRVRRGPVTATGYHLYIPMVSRIP